MTKNDGDFKSKWAHRSLSCSKQQEELKDKPISRHCISFTAIYVYGDEN